MLSSSLNLLAVVCVVNLLAVVCVASVTGSGVAARRVINDPLPAGYQDWDYSDVRPGAHLFWWLYASTNYDVPREETPLILWLQGGQFQIPFFLSLCSIFSILNPRPIPYPSLTFVFFPLSTLRAWRLIDWLW